MDSARQHRYAATLIAEWLEDARRDLARNRLDSAGVLHRCAGQLGIYFGIAVPGWDEFAKEAA